MGSHSIARLSLLTALALAVYALESMLPRPLPWLRIGLSNALVLTVLLAYGLGLAVSVSIIRTILGSLLIGSFLNPGFIVSISAGITSCLVMGAVFYLGKRIFGTVGISVFGALAHNLAQLSVAYALFIRRSEIFMLIPVFLFLSIGTGIVTGIAAHFLYQRVGSSAVAVD